MEQHLTLTTTDGFQLDTLYNKVPDSEKIVIFAHGMTVDKDDEEKFIRAGEELNNSRISTIFFDFRAHGKSTGNSITDFTISGEIEDIETVFRFVQKEGFSSIGVAGASFGGGIASFLVGNHPQEITALFLANPVLDYEQCFLYPTTPWGKNTFSDLEKRFTEHEYIVVGSRKMRVGKTLFDEMRKYFPMQSLSKYQGAMFIVHGDKDSKVSYQETKALFDQLPTQQKQFKTIHGAEHGFHEEPYETMVVKEITAFFTEQLR